MVATVGLICNFEAHNLTNVMMKKILCLVFLCMAVFAQAQDLKSCFVNMPDSLSVLLTKVNREDFGDFLDSGMKAEVKNRFGKMSEMRKLTADYLDLRLSASSRVEMKLLPLNDSVKVICVVRTYLGPVEDSKVSFYDTDWKELPAGQYLKLPAEDMFYKSGLAPAEEEKLKALRVKADMYLCKALLSDNEATLTFVYTTPGYLDKETSEQLKPYLQVAPIIYRWQEGQFVTQ